MGPYEIVLTAAALYFIATTLYNRFRTSLRAIPGPHLATWTNLWRFWNTFTGRTHLAILALHRKHGPLVRVGPNAISVSDPSMIPVIYNTSGEFRKTGFYPLQSITWHKRPQVNIFSTRDERLHREMKRKVAGAYTSDALLKMEAQIDGCGDLLVQHLRECADLGMAVNIGRWLLYYTFDVVGEITFSEKLGFLETGSDVDGMIAAGGFMMVYFACVGQIPWLHKFLLGNPLLPYLIPGFEAANTGTMFTYRAMNRRSTTSAEGHLQMKEGSTGDDMLSRWAAVRYRDPDKMSMTDVMVALATNIFAGADTTAITLRAALYHLLRNPTNLVKAVAEIEAATSAGHISVPSISDRESRTHLLYTNACIKEALRMHPAVGMLLERHVPPQGVELCGRWIPGGTVVGINPWVVSYDEDVFEDPEEFRPERWLRPEEGGISNSEKLAQMERTFLVFGAGSRVCLGRWLSWIEMRKIVPRILREFEIGMYEGQDEWKVNTAWFTPQQMPDVWVRRREAK